MGLREKFTRFERFETDWRRLLVQGWLVLGVGAFLALVSVLSPSAVVLYAPGLSFLPLSAIALLALGLLEGLDALLAKEQREFIQNLQVGVLDAVVGGLILFSLTEAPARLSLMIAAFLIVRGSVRIALCYALRLPHPVSVTTGGVLAVAMGLMIWKQWPTPAGWFLALCMNVEIAFRGWAMMMFAYWIRKQQAVPAEAER
jgi:uncharacterized membrane protein HdeD (DUF308 family)